MTWFDAFPARLPSSTGQWRSSRFEEELRSWVAGATGSVTRQEQVKLRPWAGVWRFETAGGVFYAKQNCPPQAFEAAVLAQLASRCPEHVVPVSAIDADRALLLTADLGPTLDDVDAGDVDEWCRVVAAAAELQLAMAPYAGDLESAGLTRLELSEAPAYLEARVEQVARLPEADPRHLPADAARRILARGSQVRRWAESVSALGLPVTIQHNDLHERNAFGGSTLRFFDFADAVLSDPLAVMLIPLNRLSDLWGAGPDDARLRRVVDAYLEVWTGFASLAELRQALPAAVHLGRLARVESWVRVSAAMDDAELAEWGSALPAWLRTLADADLGPG